MPYIKFAESIGRSTVGYGESKIKWYVGDHRGEARLYTDNKKRGCIIFNSEEQMLEIKGILSSTFAIVK